MLSVLTYNILLGKKLDQIMEWIASYDQSFDIICFQEFPLSRLDIFLKLIKNHYDYRFSQNFINKKRTFGELTVFNKKKLKLTYTKTVTLGPSRLERSHVRGERSSLITKFTYQKKQFLLVNTHLICIALNTTRIRQLEKILAVTSEIGTETMPTVLVGDFNYSSLIRQKRLLTFMDEKGFTNGYKTSTYQLLFLKYQLDYLFYKHCSVNDIQIPKVKYSDHFPAEFTLNFN